MISSFAPQPFEGINSLPSYVTNLKVYTLMARIPGNYEITLPSSSRKQEVKP